jgi:uncharacterized protein
MDHLREFVIPFAGLKPGNHQFEFIIDDMFFEQFEYSEIKKGRISVHLDMEKEDKMLILNFHDEGTIEVTCDRCLEPFSLPIKGNERLLVKFGAGYFEENDEVQVIPEGDSQFDVSPFIYEFLNLQLPIRRVHPEDKNGNAMCNPDIIERLEKQDEHHEPDPRWEVLNRLRDKL